LSSKIVAQAKARAVQPLIVLLVAPMPGFSYKIALRLMKKPMVSAVYRIAQINPHSMIPALS
jgi:hypothetical protein